MLSLAQARIGQIAIVCQDVARARDFYRDVLGLQHLFDAGPGLSFFQCGGVRLMLSKAEGEAVTGTSVLYYFVSGIENASRELQTRGVKMGEPHMIAKMPDHDLWLAEFKDSEGNVMALMEEKRQGAEPKLWAVG